MLLQITDERQELTDVPISTAVCSQLTEHVKNAEVIGT